MLCGFWVTWQTAFFFFLVLLTPRKSKGKKKDAAGRITSVYVAII